MKHNKYNVFKYNSSTKEIGDLIETVEGQLVSKDKSDPEISSGYVYYIKNEDNYRKFSAFHYIVKEVGDE